MHNLENLFLTKQIAISFFKKRDRTAEERQEVNGEREGYDPGARVQSKELREDTGIQTLWFLSFI